MESRRKDIVLPTAAVKNAIFSKILHIELQKLCSEMYAAFPYDNFSRQYERNIDSQDLKGGNCVYLSRMFFFAKVRCSSLLKEENCKLLISRKRVRVPHLDANHIIVLYNDLYVIELAGDDDYVLRIGSGSPGCYEARFSPPIDGLEGRNVEIVQKPTSSQSERIITSFNTSHVYYPLIAGSCTSNLSIAMREVIRINPRVFYTTRFKTGETSVLLVLERSQTDGEVKYVLGIRFGYIGKDGKYNAPKKEKKRVLVGASCRNHVESAQEFMHLVLDKIQISRINVEFAVESMHEWLTQFF